MDRRRAASGVILQKNPRSLNLTYRGSTRRAQAVEKLMLFRRENKSGELRLSSHAPNLTCLCHSVNVLLKRYISGLNVMGNVNVTRDGINNSAAANSNLAGFQAATVLNPDMVGEVRVILSPVDAEMGRGNAQ